MRVQKNLEADPANHCRHALVGRKESWNYFEGVVSVVPYSPTGIDKNRRFDLLSLLTHMK